MRENNHLPLHTCRVIEPAATINRLQFLLHLCAAFAVLYYRTSRLFPIIHLNPVSLTSVSWMFILLADVTLFFMWILSQGFRYRPVSRSVFPERLPDDDMLPHVDIFIVTADPDKEPTVEVMNTLLSVMALDYPPQKLHIYLSDDAGADVTLCAAKEAYSFGRFWVPFCKRFGVTVTCPEVFFHDSKISMQASKEPKEFAQERQKMEVLYDTFKEVLERLIETKDGAKDFQESRQEHPSEIEIIREVENNSTKRDDFTMPSLVYVAREKRKGVPHHFKAGALNVLLRVSSVVTNSPYLLVLDCDMYSNDPSSIKQAMCFHLDRKLSPNLAFVQFPQEFYNISKNDIYCAELRQVFKTLWIGYDGLRGPAVSGTNFFIKRCALYGAKPGGTLSKEEFNDGDISILKNKFGNSNELCLSVVEKRSCDFNERLTTHIYSQKDNLLVLADTKYENDTQWGDQIGFLYGSVVEDYFTGFHLHCRGWISTYCFPSRPAFLGNTPINFNNTLVQNKRWNMGLLEVAFSRHCPLYFGITKNFSSVLQSMCYAWLAFWSLYSFPLFCYGIFPQLCFLNGISLFPEVRSPWFCAFAFVFFSSCIQHLREVYSSGRIFTTWCNEQRFWMINGLTAQLFAGVNIFLKLVGISIVNFDITNKTTDETQIKRYENGVFDFEGCSLMLLPATTLSLLNMGALAYGAWQMTMLNATEKLFAQFFLSCYILALSLPLIEGIIMRQDTGRVPPRIALWSIVLSGLAIFMFS